MEKGLFASLVLEMDQLRVIKGFQLDYTSS